MSTWEEIRKLAADFQRVQLGEAAKKLSDKNCIEIVTKLIQDGSVNLVHTMDGKEYLTRQHLVTEIKNETQGNKGRVCLTDLQPILNIEYAHIEEAASSIVKSDPSFILCLGQLITKDYVDSVCEQINDWLADEGSLTVAQITKNFDLPSEFLRQVVQEELGGKIQGQVERDDPNTIYTNTFITLQKGLVRGILSALTRVTPLSVVLKDPRLKPGLLFKCIDELLEKSQLLGIIQGGHSLDRAVYVPEIFSDAVNRWISDFYSQNGYVEYANMKKLGVSDPVGHVKKQLKDSAQIVFLDSCCLSPELCSQAENSIKDSLTRHGWADIRTHTPSVLTETDVILFLSQLLKRNSAEGWNVANESSVFLNNFVSTCGRLFEPIMTEKAEKESGNFLNLLKELKSKELSGDTGVSSRSNKKDRTTKKASAKQEWNKKRGANQNDEEMISESQGANALEFMTTTEMISYLTEQFPDCPSDLLEDIVDRLRNSLNVKFREKLESVFLSSEGTSKENRKKSHAEFQEQIRVLYHNIYLMDLGAAEFEATIAGQLKTLLLRGYCTDLLNLAVCYVSDTPASDKMTPKVRDATIADMPSAHKVAFEKLRAALTTKDLGGFFDALDDVCGPTVCSINLKAPDKKTRLDILKRHQGELRKQLKETAEPAAVFLLSLLLLFSQTTNLPLNATGKFVPQILAFLSGKVEAELFALLEDLQNLVVQLLKKQQETTEEVEVKILQLKAKLQAV